MNPAALDAEDYARRKNELVGRIRACAAMAGSGDALSRKSGVPRRTLENYLSGYSEPKALVALRIAGTVGVTLDWLIGGHDAEAHSNASSDDLLAAWERADTEARAHFLCMIAGLARPA